MGTFMEKAVAVVGVGAIMPDALNADTFWQNIIQKRYSITDVPPERWSPDLYYDPDPAAPDKTYSKIGGWVRGFEFNWRRFRMPPKVAGSMDQGQQWAVTVAADALADFGYPHRPLDTERTAVILGTAMGGELHYITHSRIIFPEFAEALAEVTAFNQLPADIRRQIMQRWQEVINERIPAITEDTMPGELPNIVSGRVANLLNLRGPNFITDAACASSFAAIGSAVELLTEHKVDVVIAGGIDRNMGASTFVKFCKIGALSATGTRPFGDGADGFVMGEGAATFLLKRLADAEQQGDKIYAVIRGVGGSSDGKGKGITAPNPYGQQLAIKRAWENAGLDPATATMIEAHGTSTPVGDFAEFESLQEVFGHAPGNSIALGSVKSNIGHLKAGAGAAGFFKAVMALYHKVLPPTLNAEVPNPNINFRGTPFYLNHEAREWTLNNGHPRRCGVSAYGFGGTNFHLLVEEYVPGMATKTMTVGQSEIRNPKSELPRPVRGILALGADNPAGLKDRLDNMLQRVEEGYTPPVALPKPADIQAGERLVIDFGDHDELLTRLQRAQKVMGFDSPQAWEAMQGQGIYRGSGPAPGKIAYLFPGQGSQYVNMGRELVALSPAVQAVFDEADAVMEPILGKPLTSYIFVDADDPGAMMRAELSLMQTDITQPAVLTFDIAMMRLLETYGFRPDMVMGHSLGEYAALIAAGVMPFTHALEAAAARGSEMSKVSVEDNGKMAAILAPLEVVQEILGMFDGYVIPANINSYSQCVIGGASDAVEEVVKVFEAKGYQGIILPVSHAFHTRIVAPASEALGQVLDRLSVSPPKLPLVANVTGEIYPTNVDDIKAMLTRQIASTVQWVKGLETLYENGVRAFVEVGPKRALRGFARDVFQDNTDVIALMTNHPKTGALPAFNQALCGLYAAGYGGIIATENEIKKATPVVMTTPVEKEQSERSMKEQNGMPVMALNEFSQVLTQALQQAMLPAGPQYKDENRPDDRNEPPKGSIVISGTGLGLPGAEKAVMDPENAARILRGEQFVDLIPERFRRGMVAKRIIRLRKAEDGSGSFETIDSPEEVIKLAGRPGKFDLAEEYGVSSKLVEALDITTQLAMAAGLDALREAGIPLVMTYKKTTTGKYLPLEWKLPTALQDETGVIFASAFPGGDRFADEFSRFYQYQNRREQLQMLEDLRRYTTDQETLSEITRRIAELRDALEREPYEFDRRFLFRILSMGHSQFAQYIGARGPNTQVNAACASTAQGISIAEDWIRSGRCRRVIVIGADNVTGDNLMEWVGAGFLAVGAVTTNDRLDEAALPFDRRRHGTIMGMGACALVVESEDVLRERGMRGIVELLSSETNNSAFHGTRLNVEHIAQVMNNLVTSAERRFGLNRYAMAPQTVFMSHETYTPARGGSASAEVIALRETFGDAAQDIIVTNTKGFTGHPMGVGIEDVIAVKILEHGIVPPVPNFKEVDPELGPLNLSRGGRYPVQYALHLAAGFGSQIALTLTRRIPGSLDRIDNRPQYNRWVADVSGYDRPETEVVKRVLRVKEQGYPPRIPAGSSWQVGTGPVLRTPAGAAAFQSHHPQRLAPVDYHESSFVPRSEPVIIRPEPEPVRIVEAPVDAPKPDVPAKELTVSEPVPAAIPSDGAEARKLPEMVPSTPLPVLDSSVKVDSVSTKVLAIVAAQTGYPEDMLDLDLDLEADLGIDTVKQAETFAAIREEFNIPRRDDLSLRDYNTLEKVIGFVFEMRPDLKGTPSLGNELPPDVIQHDGKSLHALPPAGSLAVSEKSISVVSSVSGLRSPVATKVMAIVADQTGYPEDMLDLDLDLEADLGIDTVKQAETFAAIREEFAIPRREDLSLRDYNTLEKVIGFVYEMRPDLREILPIEIDLPLDAIQQDGDQVQVSPTAGSADVTELATNISSQVSGLRSPVVTKVLALIADKTGYPEEMLDLDLDLEADLGIDTVKQAETFAAIREEFNIPRIDNLKLRDYPTLEHVIGFVYEMRPDLKNGNIAAPSQSLDTSAAGGPPSVVSSPVSGPQSQVYSLTDADQMPRRIPTPILRPAESWYKPTGVTLDKNSRVIVALDEGGVGEALSGRLEKLGATVLTLDVSLPREAVVAQLQEWQSAGPIQGVYWLPALDLEQAIEQLSLDEWRELNRRRVKNLFLTMKTLYGSINTREHFLVSATRLGGLHGYGPAGAIAPTGGGITGFTKAFKRERNEALVKAVDFATSRKTAALADQLIWETLTDPGVIEIGYWEGDRYTISLAEQPADYEKPGMELNQNSVFLVTGAAGGITSAIISDLAANSGGTFYLLDLVEAPPAGDPTIALYRHDPEALRQQLIASAKAAGERPTPVTIDKQMMAVERQEAALRAIEAVEAAGGKAHYRSLNLLDGSAVAAVMDEIREHEGRLDVLVHAGGIEISRSLADKDYEQFCLVFDIKADGFYSLLHAAAGMAIGATVVFSSVAGRFGNNGQTDYSAANDLLCKLTSNLQIWRPETRAVAIDWSAWADIGMATRGSVPKIMEMAGIDMLPPSAGIPTVRRELVCGNPAGEIVVGGALGMLTDEWDETGGVELNKVNEWLATCEPSYSMLGEVITMNLNDGVKVKTTIDPIKQPFLFDHAMEGTPLLPGVMGTETFAELAQAFAPGYFVTAVVNEKFHSPFKYYRMEPQTMVLNVTIRPVASGKLVATTSLRSLRELVRADLPAQEKLHFTAEVMLSTEPAELPAVEFTPPSTADMTITAEDIYKIYFHGPAYQVLERVRVSGEEAIGLMPINLPPNSNPAGVAAIMAPRLIELCFQTAGVWDICTNGTMALPLSIERVTTYRRPEETSGQRLYARVQAIDGGASYNATVVDETGLIYVELTGYRTIALPGQVSL